MIDTATLNYPEPKLIATLHAQIIGGQLTRKQMNRGLDWHGMKTKLRPYYLAQLGICPYCGTHMPTVGALNNSDHPWFPTIDHVMPKIMGGGNYRNQLLCHFQCNHRKAHRPPTAEEALQAVKVGNIVEAFFERCARGGKQ